MEEWRGKGRVLSGLLKLRTSLLAVKLLRTAHKGERLPEEVTRPLKDLGVKVAVCQALGMARRLGRTVGLAGEESACPPASILFGWAEPEDEMDLVNAWVEMGICESAEAVKRSVEALPKFGKGECSGMVVSPLESTVVAPDVVLLYCDSAQAMALIHGCLFRDGGSLKFSSMATAVCAESIIAAALSGEPKLAIPCIGDRRYEMTHDDELILAIPGDRVGQVIEGLEARFKRRGPEYPTHHHLTFQPDLSPAYKKLEKKLKLV